MNTHPGFRPNWSWTLMLLLVSAALTTLQACRFESTLTAAGDFGVGEIAAGGETVLLRVAEPSFICLTVEQMGIDLEVHLRSGLGEELISRNGAQQRQSQESICTTLEHPGEYTLELEAVQEQEMAGRFRWTVDILRPPSDLDAQILKAEQADLGAFEAIRTGSAEGLEETRRLLTEASDAWRRLGEPAREARSLAMRGATFLNLGRAAEAEQDFENALAIAEEEELPSLRAHAHLWLGGIAQRRGETVVEHQHTEAALELYREIGDPSGQAEAIDSLAFSSYDRAKYDEAVELLNQSLVIWRGLGNTRKQGKTLGHLGLMAEDQGRLEEAFDLHRQALELRSAAEDRVGVAVTLANLARAHLSSGEYHKAMELYGEAAEKMEATGRIEYLGSILGNLGVVYRRLGQLERASAVYRRSFEIAERAGSNKRMVILRNNMGNAAIRLGNFDEARRHLEWARIKARDLDFEDLLAASLKNMGDLELRSSRPKPPELRLAAARRAKDYFEKAEEKFTSIALPREVTGCLIGRAEALAILEQPGPATKLLRRAVELAREHRDKARLELALSLLGKLMADEGHFDDAAAYFEEAISIFESQRGALAGRDLRSSFMSRRRRLYAEAVRALVKSHGKAPDAGHLESAFLMAERAKARSLVDFLGTAQIEANPEGDHDSIERIRAAERRIAFHERRWQGAHRRGDHEKAKTHLQDIEEVSRHRDELLKELMERSPRYAALTTGLSMDVEKVRQEVLPEDGLFLEYVLEEEGSLLFALSQGSLEVFELAPRSVIEAEIERFLAAVGVRSDATGAIAERSASQLSRLLLQPAAHLFAETPSWLLVVGDGWLHGLPFSYLANPGDKDREPLLAATRVVQLPSASATLLLKSLETRDFSKILAVAAPKYSIPKAEPGEDLTRDASEFYLPPLEFARREAEVLASLAPDQAVLLLDAEANIDAVAALNLGSFDLLHFGVHAVIEPSRPGASGLVLAILDEDGEPQQGLLSVRDVYNLDLNAQLVVLSACRSAGGDLVRGEGLVGLVSAFLYAGSRSVVASLWQVEDHATSILMSEFYNFLLKEKMPPAEALRAAQMSLRERPEFESPYFWAPFVFIGPGH